MNHKPGALGVCCVEGWNGGDSQYTTVRSDGGAAFCIYINVSHTFAAVLLVDGLTNGSSGGGRVESGNGGGVFLLALKCSAAGCWNIPSCRDLRQNAKSVFYKELAGKRTDGNGGGIFQGVKFRGAIVPTRFAFFDGVQNLIGGILAGGDLNKFKRAAGYLCNFVVNYLVLVVVVGCCFHDFVVFVPVAGRSLIMFCAAKLNKINVTTKYFWYYFNKGANFSGFFTKNHYLLRFCRCCGRRWRFRCRSQQQGGHNHGGRGLNLANVT